MIYWVQASCLLSEHCVLILREGKGLKNYLPWPVYQCLGNKTLAISISGMFVSEQTKVCIWFAKNMHIPAAVIFPILLRHIRKHFSTSDFQIWFLSVSSKHQNACWSHASSFCLDRPVVLVAGQFIQPHSKSLGQPISQKKTQAEHIPQFIFPPVYVKVSPTFT